MPEMSGREVADQLRQIRPTTKILYMSGFTDDAVLCMGRCQQRARSYRKSITSSALASKVRGALDTSTGHDLRRISGNPFRPPSII